MASVINSEHTNLALDFDMSAAAIPTDNVEINTLNRLVETIEDVKNGLDVEVIASWYSVIESESKALCPTEELRESVYVVQNALLPMKFEFKASKRAIPYVLDAIENNLNSMPFATRLYFQKFEEILQTELSNYLKTTYSNVPDNPQ